MAISLTIHCTWTHMMQAPSHFTIKNYPSKQAGVTQAHVSGYCSLSRSTRRMVILQKYMQRSYSKRAQWYDWHDIVGSSVVSAASVCHYTDYGSNTLIAFSRTYVLHTTSYSNIEHRRLGRRGKPEVLPSFCTFNKVQRRTRLNLSGDGIRETPATLSEWRRRCWQHCDKRPPPPPPPVAIILFLTS